MPVKAGRGNRGDESLTDADIAAAIGDKESPENVLEKNDVQIGADFVQSLNDKISALEADKTAALLEIERLNSKISDLTKQVEHQSQKTIAPKDEPVATKPLHLYEIVDTLKPDIPVSLGSGPDRVDPVIDEFGFPHYKVSISVASTMLASVEGRWVLTYPKNINEITAKVRRGLYNVTETFKRHVLVRSDRKGNKWVPYDATEE